MLFFKKMTQRLPYSRQSISKQDINAVTKVLKSDIIARGKIIERLESKISNFVGSKYSIAVNSATSALHLACLALGVKKGDVVWTTANTFVASANCAEHLEAKVDFIDIKLSTGNLDVVKLKEKLEKEKKKPKVIVLVHFAGQPVEQEKIFKLSKKYKFKIIEDASHALGAKRKKQTVGNCKWSDVCIFSLHPVKIITSGEGGIATTNNPKIYESMKILRNHGITKDKNLLQKKIFSKWYYEMLKPGYNYWMSDINAALALSQLKSVNKFIRRRNEIAKKYNQNLDTKKIYQPIVLDDNYCSFHLYVMRLKSSKFKIYLKVFNYLLKKKIDVNMHYLPIHLHPYYKAKGFKKGDFPLAEKHSMSAISLPIYYGLKNKEIKYVIKHTNHAVNIYDK